jgi:hypothetical protein
MNNFTRTLFLLSLTISATSGWLQAQQPGTTKGIVTIQDVKLEKVEMKSKEISREVAMPKNGEVYIENNSRNIVIKTWDQPKVKISTVVLYEGEGNFTEDEWFEKANLSLKTLGSSVKIKAGLVNNPSAYSTNLYNRGNNILTEVVATGRGQATSSAKTPKKLVTVYLPAGSKIDIESKYSEVTLPANIGDANVEISNGNLDAENLGKFSLRSQYAIVNIGDVKNAEIEFTGGRLTAKTIDELDLDSKYATIELALAKKAKIRSTNDEYEFEEIGELSGRKNYGNFRITRLLQKFEITGANADIKIRNIAPTVSLIKIDDKYADIRLPVKNTKNYSVDFMGPYSSVYGNFEKKAIAFTEKDIQALAPGSAGYVIDSAGNVTNRIAVNGKRISTASDAKATITSVGNLTNLTVPGTISGGTFSGTLTSGTLNNIVVPGTITGGTFSGTLASAGSGQYAYSTASGVSTGSKVSGQLASGGTQVTNNITTLGNLTAITVSGYITKADGNIINLRDTVYTTTIGKQSNLTVAGNITASTMPMNAVTVTGYGTSSQNGITVNGVRTADTYRTPTGIITGGTFVPFNRAYSYTGDNDTPSKFTATVGDGKGLKIEMKCPNCTVDFK